MTRSVSAYYAGFSLDALRERLSDPEDMIHQYGTGMAIGKALDGFDGMFRLNPCLAPLSSEPLGMWPADMVDFIVRKGGFSVAWLDLLAPELLDQGLAELSVEHGARLYEVPERFKTESLYIKALTHHSDGLRTFLIAKEDQTPDIVEAMLAGYGQQVQIMHIRPDLVSDSVVGRIMSNFTIFQSPNPELLRRGMRWLMDNGMPPYPATGIPHSINLTDDEQGLGGLFEIALTLERELSKRDHYHVMETIRRYPLDEQAAAVKTDEQVGLFQRMHGSKRAIELLGERVGTHKRAWIEQDFSL